MSENGIPRGWSKSDFILLDIDADMLLNSVKYSISHEFADNLRQRGKATALDSKVRGHIAELGIRKFLKQNGFPYEMSGKVNDDGDTDVIMVGKMRNITMEIKSSLLPDLNMKIYDYDMDYLYDKDIKMIARRPDDPESVMARDIYLQIYFSQPTKEREARLEDLILPEEVTAEWIMDNFGYTDFLNGCFFVGWITGCTEYHNLKMLGPENDKWAYKGRQFWRCPLSSTNKPSELIPFLRTI